MANLKDLIVNGAARIIGKTYSSEFVGNVTGDVTGNLTGNVTGNVSGSSESCNGNAATSSKLKTAVSLTTTDGTNTSTGVNFDGSAATSIKLPSTIAATFSGNLTGDVTGSVSGNAGTATKLKTARSLKITDDGTNTSTGVDFDGSSAVTLKLPSTIKASITGNATTATTADKTAYGISVGDGVSSTVAISSWKGNEAKTLAIKGTSPITTTATTDTITITHNKGGANTSRGDTDNQAPGFGGTFKVTSATVDVYGHTTTLADHTVTIPDTAASTSASGIVTTGTQKFAGAKTFADTTDSTNNTTGAVTISGGLGVAGNIYAGAVYGAVWNDLSDSIPVDDDCDLEHGYCYCFDGEKYSKSSKYLDDGIIGIHSDTYGFKMGAEEGKKKMDVAVSGFVLAYVDKEYKPGTPLTCTKNGYLTKIKLRDKIRYPEKIIATYWKSEPADELGSGSRKVRVNGRKWVKVK